MDLWGKPFTAAGAQSVDGKSTYVLLRLAGDIGQMEANESVDAVRELVDKDTPPPGLRVYVSGAAPLASDTLSIANNSLNNITIVTIILIFIMLLLVYRGRITTLVVPMYSVLFEILVAKGVVSTLGHVSLIPLSSFAVNVVISLTLGAGTDYGIFLMGRYQEARQDGESPEEAYYTAFQGRGTDHHRLGTDHRRCVFCLSFARLNYFHTMGPAVAITMLFTIAAALTLAPALLTLGSIFGLYEPKNKGQGTPRTGGSARAWCVGRLRFWRPAPRSSCSARSSCRPISRTTTTGSTSRQSRRPKRASRPPTGTSRRASCSPRC